MYRDRLIHPRVKDMQLPRLGKPRCGLQIFDTRVDFPVPVQSGGRFYYSVICITMSPVFLQKQRDFEPFSFVCLPQELV